LDKKSALCLLNINKETTKKQIEKRFEIILRQAKFDKTIDTKVICEAYDYLTKNYNYEDKGKSILKRKFENFCYYYLKPILFISGIALFVIFSVILISLYIKAHPKPDLTVIFVGNHILVETQLEDIEDYFTDNFNLKNIDVRSYIIVEDESPNYGEYTLKQFISLTNNIETGFIVTTGINILDLIKESYLAGFSHIELGKLNISKEDRRISEFYSNAGTPYPYAIKLNNTNFLGIENITKDFPYIAVLKTSMFNNKVYSIIKVLLKSD